MLLKKDHNELNSVLLTKHALHLLLKKNGWKNEALSWEYQVLRHSVITGHKHDGYRNLEIYNKVAS